MSAFQKYWNALKTERPTVYEEKLESNRQRIKKLRQAIYADPEKHAAYKAAQRAAYKARTARKKTQQLSKSES